MPYQIEFTPAARRQYQKLPDAVRQRVRPRLRALAEDPRPAGAKKLAAPIDLFRIRVGDYRIVYEVRDRVLVVLVVTVAHRRDAYRDY